MYSKTAQSDSRIINMMQSMKQLHMQMNCLEKM